MKEVSASGIKSADFRIRIPEKTHGPPGPLLIVWKVNDPPYMHSLKTGAWPGSPLYSATSPPLSAEIYEQSLRLNKDTIHSLLCLLLNSYLCLIDA